MANFLNQRRALLRSFVPITAQLIEDGDSLTVGLGVVTPANNWTAVLQRAFRQFRAKDIAVSGYTTANLLSGETANVVNNFNAALSPNVVTAWVGTNDVVASTSAATIYSNLQSYTAAAKTAGYKVIWATMLPRTGLTSAMLAVMAAYNVLIRGATLGQSNTADALADLQNDNTVGPLGAASDHNLYCLTPGVFSSGVHVTDAGQVFLAPYFISAMQQLLAPAAGTLLVDENFATGVYSPGPVTSDLVDTRSTVQSVKSSAGVLSQIAANTLALSDVALSSEPAGANSLLQSQALATSPWTLYQVVSTNNATTAPDGTTTATNVIQNAITTTGYVMQTFSIVGGNLYTFSVWAKPNGINFLRINPYTGASSPSQTFDLGTGAVGVTAGSNPIAPTIEAFTNGWYRCAFSFYVPASSASASMSLVLQNANNSSSWLGTGTTGLFLWGAQVEIAAAPSSYITTTLPSQEDAMQEGVSLRRRIQ